MNAATGEEVDMFKEGIIDPTKVVRTEIVSAGRVASLMLTTECMIVNIPEKEPSTPGGMGGMGGMGGSALLYATKYLKEIKADNMDIQSGINIVYE